MRKKHKQIFYVELILCMLIFLVSITAYANEGSAFISGQYEVDVGENIEIELKATDSTGVIAMLCEVEFDGEFLEILRYDDEKLIGGTLTAKTDESPMRLFWMDALASKNTLVEGTLGKFTFKALKAGKTEINVTGIEAYTKDGDLVNFENAVIEVNIKETDIPVEETTEYTISALAGKNGKINPSGEIKVTEGKQLLFIFTPDSGYKVDDVKVDGKSIGAVLEYTYESVEADSEIEVTFTKIRSSGGSGSSSSSSGKKPSSSGTSSSSGEKEEKPTETPSDKPKTEEDNNDKKETTSDEETTPKEPDKNTSDETTDEDTITEGKVTEDKTEDEEETQEKQPAETEWINPFIDVKEDEWFYKYVKYINSNKLMNGMSETEFAPNGTVTRAMFVTVLYRLEKEPEAPKPDFSDVPEGAYYENAVGWALQSEIVNGISETEFAPGTAITREQMATIIHRYMKYKGVDVSSDATADITSYNDFEEITLFAVDAFRYTCSKGIINGITETTLAPKESATRAQMAAIFQRCEKVLLNQ